MRVVFDQTFPFVEVLKTRSLAVQPGSNTQSDHTTYTLPDASISAEGRGIVARMLPFGKRKFTTATLCVEPQVAPPSVETKALMVKLKRVKPLIGTITVPSGCTRGCPPMPNALFWVVCAGDQFDPPLVEVLISTWSPSVLSSNSV